jgi:hypothetical protein
VTGGEAAPVRYPRPTGPRTVIGPQPPGIRRSGHLRYRRGQSGLLAMQRDDCLGQLVIAEGVRVELEEPVYRAGQRSPDLIECTLIYRHQHTFDYSSKPKANPGFISRFFGLYQ